VPAPQRLECEPISGQPHAAMPGRGALESALLNCRYAFGIFWIVRRRLPCRPAGANVCRPNAVLLVAVGASRCCSRWRAKHLGAGHTFAASILRGAPVKRSAAAPARQEGDLTRRVPASGQVSPWSSGHVPAMEDALAKLANGDAAFRASPLLCSKPSLTVPRGVGMLRPFLGSLTAE
jgi:hypothetical protein